MKIENGCLLSVTKSDIQNGTFTIPQGVTSIGYKAFYNRTWLTSITIPQGVTSIGAYAFIGCRGLTSITIPQGLTSIDHAVFSGCSGLTSITIPQGLTSIGSLAFYHCTGLTSITIPQGVTSIGKYAFNNCSNLNSIVINTNDKKEFERIKNLIHAALREKVVIKTDYDKAQGIIKDALEKVLLEPKTNPYYGYDRRFSVLFKNNDILTNMNKFLKDNNEYFIKAKNEMQAVKISCLETEGDFKKYKSDISDIAQKYKKLAQTTYPYQEASTSETEALEQTNSISSLRAGISSS